MVQCSGQPVLPVGLKDEIGADTVKIFCPKCQCVYHPPVVRHRGSLREVSGNAGVDGASFGTTFPHLFLMTFSNLVPDPLPGDSVYIPRVFGFRVHSSARQRSIPLSASPTQVIAPRQGQRASKLSSEGYIEDISKSETAYAADNPGDSKPASASASLPQQQEDEENSGNIKSEDETNKSKRKSVEPGNGIADSSSKRRKRQEAT